MAKKKTPPQSKLEHYIYARGYPSVADFSRFTFSRGTGKGVSETTLRRVIHKKHIPHKKTVKNIADALAVRPEDIFSVAW